MAVLLERRFESFCNHTHSRIALGSIKASIPCLPYSRRTPENLNPPRWCLWIVGHVVNHDLPARKREAARRAFEFSSHNCRVKAVVGVVGNVDCIVLGVVSDDTEDWRKISSGAIVMSFFSSSH
jgi:hypothetical protein